MLYVYTRCRFRVGGVGRAWGVGGMGTFPAGEVAKIPIHQVGAVRELLLHHKNRGLRAMPAWRVIRGSYVYATTSHTGKLIKAPG